MIYLISWLVYGVDNISVISWRSVLLAEKTTDLSQVTDKLYHIKLFRVHLACAGFELTTLVTVRTKINVMILHAIYLVTTLN
jgi:hypothetical protein